MVAGTVGARAADAAPLLVPVGSRVLTDKRESFGGLSGLEVLDAGHLAAISDRGWIVRLGKSPPFPVTALQALGGLPRAHYLQDSESLRRTSDGGWLVSFEGASRVARHRPGWQGLAQPPRAILLRRELRGLTGNRSLEAVAALPDGRGLALAEQTGDALAVLFDREGRQLRRLAFRTAWPPVDALALADGGLLILTRTPTWPLPPTFATRLEYVAPGWDAGPRFESRPLFRLDDALPAENYEGLAAEPLTGNWLRLWLVSDDNYLGLQSTILAWLDLPLACLRADRECRLEPGATATLRPAPTPRSRPSPVPQ